MLLLEEEELSSTSRKRARRKGLEEVTVWRNLELTRRQRRRSAWSTNNKMFSSSSPIPRTRWAADRAGCCCSSDAVMRVGCRSGRNMCAVEYMV